MTRAWRIISSVLVTASVLAAGAPAVTAAGPLTQRCTNEVAGFSVSFPSDWYTNEPREPSDMHEGIPACTSFGPEPHTVPPNRADNAPIFLAFQERGLLDGRHVTIDGRRGVVHDTVVNGQAWRVYDAYISNNRSFSAFVKDNGSADYDEARAVLDAMMETVNIDGDDQPFADTYGNSFEFEIEWLLTEGITRGCADGTKFCPRETVMRDQMASFLVRALDLPPPSGDHFVDDEGNLHEDDINSLFEAGVTKGCDTHGRYCPTSAVTRDQMASFLVRALQRPPASGDHFVDDEGNFHEDDINSLFEAGVTNGCGPGAYCPSQAVAREQMAAFLYRALAD
jgi:hypothetical protein